MAVQILSYNVKDKGIVMRTSFINTTIISNRNHILVGLVVFALATQFVFSIAMARADENLIRDKHYLISLAKQIENESKIGRHDLDNMDVKIYKIHGYVVLYFSPKQTPHNVMRGGDITYYFTKKEGGGYQFVKCVLGQ